MSKLTTPQLKGVGIVCTTVSVGTALATPFLMTHANKKAREVIEYYGLELEPLKVKAKYTWKCYIPVGAVMALGFGSSITSGIFLQRTATSLSAEIAAHALTVAGNTEVKEAIFAGIKEKYGLDVEQEMRDKGAQRTMDTTTQGLTHIPNAFAAPHSGGGVQLYDELHGRHYVGSIEDLKTAVNNINAEINFGNDRTLADVMDELGHDRGSIDTQLGPKPNELFELTYGHSIFEGQPCLHWGFSDLIQVN